MVDSKINLKRYFLPIYYIWAFISPTLILMINNIPTSRYPAFYAIWGLIWPITFVTYPAFLRAIQLNNYTVFVGSINIAIPLFFIAWLGPVVHLIIMIVLHKRYLEELNLEQISWTDYFYGFI